MIAIRPYIKCNIYYVNWLHMAKLEDYHRNSTRVESITSLHHHHHHQCYAPKAGPSLQAEIPRLQFCRRQVFHRKLRNQGCSFTRDLIGALASSCFPHPTLS